MIAHSPETYIAELRGEELQSGMIVVSNKQPISDLNPDSYSLHGSHALTLHCFSLINREEEEGERERGGDYIHHVTRTI
jgi:hypothetical protein